MPVGLLEVSLNQILVFSQKSILFIHTNITNNCFDYVQELWSAVCQSALRKCL
jgi:hypothetical protein